jgi:hypothetical protein
MLVHDAHTHEDISFEWVRSWNGWTLRPSTAAENGVNKVTVKRSRKVLQFAQSKSAPLLGG